LTFAVFLFHVNNHLILTQRDYIYRVNFRGIIHYDRIMPDNNPLSGTEMLGVIEMYK